MADSIGKVAKRYAQALFELVEPDQREQCTAALQEIVVAWKTSEELRLALLNPAFPISERVAALRALFDNLESSCTEASKEMMKNFLAVVLENGRIASIESLANSFQELVEASQNIIAVTVTSARPLPEDEKSAIQERLKAAGGGAKASITWKEDASLIAGMQIKIGDSVLDSSVRGALGKARAALG